MGAGYVGLPLAQVFAGAGNDVLLVDVDRRVVDGINRGESHIEDVPSEALEPLVEKGLVRASSRYDDLRDADAILIALATPLTKQREPDLSIVTAAVRDIAERLQKGQLVVLESTTYPGTTREIVQPLLEEISGLKAGDDFYLAFSPERVDPGNEHWSTKTVPKIVGGIDEESTRRAAELYDSVVDTVHAVSSPEAAELTKLLENIFRSVNIALVNELAQLCERMGIDVWEVVDAAATKPFGFMSFKPGAGPGRPLHSGRSFLPDLEGQGVRLLHRVHRAGRKGQRGHALPLPLADLAGAQPRRAQVAERVESARPRRGLQVRHLRRARVAGAQGHAATREGRRRRLLPRPARTVAGRQELSAARARRLRLRRDHDRAFVDRPRPGRTRGERRRRLPQRHGRRGPRRPQGLEAVTRVGVVGLGYWGPNLARNFDALAELAWICDASREYLEAFSPGRPYRRGAHSG